MNEQTNVFIWAEVPYKTNQCQRCGHTVRGADGMPAGDTLLSVQQGLIFCPECGQCVAETKVIKKLYQELYGLNRRFEGRWNDDFEN